MKTRKKRTRVETKTKEATKVASAKVEPSTPRPKRIKLLKKDAVFRGASARQAWYERLKEYDGKTEEEFLASVKEKSPSLTRNQTAEPPSGWMRFFVRQGVLSIQQ